MKVRIKIINAIDCINYFTFLSVYEIVLFLYAINLKINVYLTIIFNVTDCILLESSSPYTNERIAKRSYYL